MKASEAYIRIIIRRPHAYAFAAAHDAAPIPGLSFLTADGKRVGGYSLGGEPDAKKLLEEMKAQAK
ncbi:MAG: hypothetical protein FD180_2630 [Planctomycetota bacterium]|nr:MAG: hypothetical protein FD180_2630 [Planctomycetota bacterium]